MSDHDPEETLTKTELEALRARADDSGPRARATGARHSRYVASQYAPGSNPDLDPGNV